MNQEEKIEQALALMDPDTSVETIAENFMRIDELIRRAKQFKEEFEQQCIEWIEANDRDIEIPGPDGSVIRYYIGNAKSVKCADVPGTLLELLQVAAGDLDAVANCLGSSAWKHGAVKKLLADLGAGDKYDQLFRVEERQELKEGKPVKQLQKFDSRFYTGTPGKD